MKRRPFGVAALVLSLAGCGGEERKPVAGRDGPPGSLLVFPRRHVVVTPGFETFPVFLRGGRPGGVAYVRMDEDAVRAVALDQPLVRLDLPLCRSEHRVDVVEDVDPGGLRPHASFRISVLPFEAAAALLKRQLPDDEEEGTDLVPADAGPVPLYFDDEPPFVALYPEILTCFLDVDVHRPLSQDDAEPVVPEAQDLTRGAYTLRNDDGDGAVGATVRRDELPVAEVETDITRQDNANENDLVRVDVQNLLGLPRVHLFAFALEAEADRALGTPVNPVDGGRQATAQELSFWSNATKAAPAPALPRPVPQGVTTFWLEGLLGGRYRLVVGVLPGDVEPAQVRYDRKAMTTVPALGCIRQATVTVVVVDIVQEGSRAGTRRTTAFDVLWGGRPYFRAEVWPPGGQFEWAAPYKLGRGPDRQVLGQAVSGEVAFMERDDTEGEPAGQNEDRARGRGRQVRARGTAGSGNKAEIEGGIVVDTPRDGQRPTVNRDTGDRYPHRISVAYTVEGERLVRPEHLEVVLPQLEAAPAAALVAGTRRDVSSAVPYAIVDAFSRRITAATVREYLDFYGAGLKAWEALEMDANTREGGRRNDTVRLTNVGRNLPPLPITTAQRSQARVLANRMTQGSFTDTLTFRTRPGVNDRLADWRAWTRRGTPQAVQQARDEATRRADEYRRAGNDPARLQPLQAADAARTGAFPVFNIRQDVILQIRSGAVRYDVNVLQGNRLILIAPYFFENFADAGRDEPFRFRLQLMPGTVVSALVDANHLRTPP